MYKLNSGFRWTSSAEIEIELMGLVLIPEEIDSDIQQLEQQQLSRNNTTDFNSNYTNTNGEITSFQKLSKSQDEQKLEDILSNLLKHGVLIASTVVFVGGILYLIRHGLEPADYHIFRGTPPQFCSPSGVITSIFAGSGRGIIQLGLLILISVPILRVVISFLVFMFQRKFTYVMMTLLVLATISYSLVSAYL
jgi:uncharacterized membrane protein